MIPSISNELEFSLEGVAAEQLLGNGLPLLGEVNPRDMVELNISLARTPDELNERLDALVNTLQEEAARYGGSIYGGGSVLSDTSDVTPARYRTTSLSDTLARGLLDITSQQIVIGLEQDNWELYDYLTRLSPVLIAASAASPHAYRDRLVPTGAQSRRVAAYTRATSRLPPGMSEQPRIGSRDEFEARLQHVSDEVNRLLERGALDATPEIATYAPFTRLDPHQVYWMVRPRPDHANSECSMSLEVRAPDLPVTRQRMQFMNSLLIGLAYCAVDTPHELPGLPEATENALQRAAYGIDARLNGHAVRDVLPVLITAAGRGLTHRGAATDTLYTEGERLLKDGAEAQRLLPYMDAAQLRCHLGDAL